MVSTASASNFPARVPHWRQKRLEAGISIAQAEQ
jgi:hypothetical protein